MSYLDLPRFHIIGRFFTDPPTTNNDPSHYEPDCLNPSPWQDPNGTHSFKFLSVNVTAAMDAGGELITSGDPLIGAAVSSVDTPIAARLVDLDVYQQGTSQLWGLQVSIPVGTGAFAGFIDLPSLNSLRFQRVLPTRGWQDWDGYGAGSYGGDTNAVGVFQSVLRVAPATWPTGSPLLDSLREACITDANGLLMISCRMVMDGYINVPGHQLYRTGRILMTLGPVLSASEPLQAPGHRWMSARALGSDAKWYWPNLYDAPIRFADRGDVQTVVVDLANALATVTPAGDPVNLGDLTIRIGEGLSGPVSSFQCNASLYTNLGGIMEIPITPDQYAARYTPLSITTSLPDIGGATLWAEDPSGFYFTAENRVLRLTSEPDSACRTATTRVYATQWGEPAPGVQLGVEAVSVVNGIKGATVPWSAGYKGNTPQAEGALSVTLGLTDTNGWATLSYEVVKDPGFRTTQLDGQLYFVVLYNPDTGPAPDLSKAGVPQEQTISVVAMSSYAVKQHPAWSEIQDMMRPYVKLYPAMNNNIRLDDTISFQLFATNPPWANAYPNESTPYTLPNGTTIATGSIPFFMTRAENDPRLMPITRDLSPNKVLTALYFIYDLIQQMSSSESGGGKS